MKKYRAIGLMSGSSLDGLDIAFCEFNVKADGDSGGNPISGWQLLDAETIPFSTHWQQKLKELPTQNALEFSKAHTAFGHYIAGMLLGFLKKHTIEPDFIASHGHTIFHYPDCRLSVQIGDGATIAALCGYPVIDNFRAQDIALGGQGAPIAPIADRMLFHGYDFFLNIGGIANISCDANGKYIAFDIGGANQVLNALVQPRGMAYDEDGRLAAAGQLNRKLLETINRLEYFNKPYPKSLGNDWVGKHLFTTYCEFDCPLEDKLHTACIQIAGQIEVAIRQIIEREKLLKQNYRLLATGGGALNRFLMNCIQRESEKACSLEVVIPRQDIISYKEAILMALMGALRIENIPNCMSSVTGAKRDVIAGAVHGGMMEDE